MTVMPKYFIIASCWFIIQGYYVHVTVTDQIILRTIYRQEVSGRPCLLPEPIQNGNYRFNLHRCPPGNAETKCRLEPGQTVPDQWALYFSCDLHYSLQPDIRASLCKNGDWTALPSCIPNITIIARDEWAAKPPVSDFPEQRLPVGRVIIAHTATDPCDSRPDCVILVQSIQRSHVQSYGDIGYNFLVGGEGLVFEGQGWEKIGAHTLGYNTGSISISLIGNYIDKPAPSAMLSAVKSLIDYGSFSGKISKDFKLNAHCQLIQIASPGKNVFEKIKSWRNWDSVNALQCI